jgi:UDP-N-acetylmuramyl pentapeptide phosphotransferase/UDP-N-acetylglucosamine-1-phosphate transferase
MWLHDLKNPKIFQDQEEAGGLIDPWFRSLPIYGLASIGVWQLATLSLFGTFVVASFYSSVLMCRCAAFGSSPHSNDHRTHLFKSTDSTTCCKSRVLTLVLIIGLICACVCVLCSHPVARRICRGCLS